MLPGEHMIFKQRHINIASTLMRRCLNVMCPLERCIDVYAMLYKRRVPAGYIRLNLSMIGQVFSRRSTEIFSDFTQNTRLDISCKIVSEYKTICMKCQTLFSGGKVETLICRLLNSLREF